MRFLLSGYCGKFIIFQLGRLHLMYNIYVAVNKNAVVVYLFPGNLSTILFCMVKSCGKQC